MPSGSNRRAFLFAFAETGFVDTTRRNRNKARSYELRINAVQRASKRNGLAHMVEAADPRHHALNAHAEARMRHAAIAAQVEIPLERVERQALLLNAALEQLVTGHALRSADHFAVSLGRQHIHAESKRGIVGVGLHVKRFDGGWIAMHHYGAIEL